MWKCINIRSFLYQLSFRIFFTFYSFSERLEHCRSNNIRKLLKFDKKNCLRSFSSIVSKLKVKSSEAEVHYKSNKIFCVSNPEKANFLYLVSLDKFFKVK